jgi:hypothetical protein
LEKPHKKIRDYESEVDVIESPDRAAAILAKMLRRYGTIAFDYETNMKKPYDPKARIISCAVSWQGEKTVAYPWVGEAIPATIALLRSPNHPKIAANLKFEDSWTATILKVKVANWLYCTMTGAHIIDNRAEEEKKSKGATSVKFQAFVQLGFPPWDEHIKPYLKGTRGGNEVNRIDEIPLHELLKYNGLDALLEYEVAMKHKPILESMSQRMIEHEGLRRNHSNNRVRVRPR